MNKFGFGYFWVPRVWRNMFSKIDSLPTNFTFILLCGRTSCFFVCCIFDIKFKSSLSNKKVVKFSHNLHFARRSLKWKKALQPCSHQMAVKKYQMRNRAIYKKTVGRIELLRPRPRICLRIVPRMIQLVKLSDDTRGCVHIQTYLTRPFYIFTFYDMNIINDV